MLISDTVPPKGLDTRVSSDSHQGHGTEASYFSPNSSRRLLERAVPLLPKSPTAQAIPIMSFTDITGVTSALGQLHISTQGFSEYTIRAWPTAAGLLGALTDPK
jgi:hypothetical protein